MLHAAIVGPYALGEWPTEWIDGPVFASAPSANSPQVVPSVVPDPGDTIGTAYDIGTLGTTQEFDDSVDGTSDVNDFYKFQVSAVSKVNFSLAGLDHNVDLTLWTVNGSNVVLNYFNGGTSSHSFFEDLAPGEDYYIQVHSGGPTENTDYTLTINTSVIPQDPTSDPGNTFPAALDLGTLGSTQSETQFVGTFDPDDIYKFQVSTVSKVSFSLAGLDNNVDLTLWTVNGSNVVLNYFNGGTSSHSFFEDLAPGEDYYIQVHSGGPTENTDYTLTINTSVIPQDPTSDPGNTFPAALDLGTLGSTQSETQFVGTFDPDDIYKFQVSTVSKVSFSLADLDNNVDLTLWTVNGSNVVLNYFNGGTSSHSFFEDLAPGEDYYIQVHSGGPSENTDYTLTINTSVIPQDPTSDPGNTFPAALDLGTLGSTQSETQFVGTFDPDDIYKFQVSTVSKVSFSLADLDNNVDLTLWTVNGSNVVLNYFNGGTSSHSFFEDLAPGEDYYIQVHSGGPTENTDYTLTINTSVIPQDPTSDPGNTFPAALDLGTLGSTQSETQFVGTFDPDDIYKFQVSTVSKVSFSLAGLDNNVDLTLWTVNGSNVVLNYFNGGTSSHSFFEDLAPGEDYYIQVHSGGPSENTDYTLTINTSVIPQDPTSDPGNTFPAALDLGTLGSTQSETQFVGTFDPDDIYKFQVSTVSKVSFSLAGLDNNVDLTLWTVNGSNVVLNYFNGGTSSHSFFEDLAPGEDYYIQVHSGGPSENTDYTLTINTSVIPQDPTSDPGNTFPAALDLGTLGSTQSETQFVGTFDPDDIYKFQVSTVSKVSFSLADLDNNVDLTLWTVNGSNVVLNYFNGGTSSHSFFEDLAPGEDYYIQVHSGGPSENTDYTLSIDTTPIPQDPTSDPGQTRQTAYDLGTLSPAVPQAQAMNFVGTFDNSDVYRFELAQVAQTTFTVSQLTDSAYLTVFHVVDGVEQQLASTGSSSSNRVINLTLDAGEYFVRIATPDLQQNTRYHLEVAPNFYPSVVQVLVNGTSWPQAFQMSASGPEPVPGVRIPTGNGDQLRALPWLNINQISLVFSEDVIVAADDLALTGINVAAHPLALNGFSYDSIHFTATWTFVGDLGTDRYTLQLLSDAATGVRDHDGNALDGEWDNPATINDTQSSQTSGDGSPGGDLVFNFNVLIGDVDGDGQVSNNDVDLTRSRIGVALGSPSYNLRADVNVNTAITTADLGLIRSQVGQVLPPQGTPEVVAQQNATDTVIESLTRDDESTIAELASEQDFLLPELVEWWT